MDSPAGAEPVVPIPRRGSRRLRASLAAVAAALLAVAAILVLTGASKGLTGASKPAAKNFSLAELGHPGQRVSLAALAGRPVVINFFASWCTPCRRETPLLASFYREHHGKVLVIGIDSNDEQPAALKFLKAEHVTYPVGFDPFPAAVAAKYGLIALPQTFMLNAKHQIVRRISGDVTLSELDAWADSVAGTGGS